MTLHLGQTNVRGSLEHYARFFDLLEVSTDAEQMPRGAVFRRWRASVPSAFSFSVCVPRRLATLGADDPIALDAFWRIVEALGAQWLVIRTPRTVTPTNRHRDRLGELVRKLKAKDGRVAWRAEGLWEPDDAQRFASALDVCWVADVGREDLPVRDSVYATLRTLGSGGVVGSSMIERAAERLSECDHSSVVLEGRGAGRAATLIRQAVVELGADGAVDPEADDNEAEEKP